MDSYSFFFLFFFGINRWFIGYSLSDTNAKFRRKQSAKELGKNGVCWRGKWGPTRTLTLLYTALKYALICCAYSLYRNAVSVPLNYIIILFFLICLNLFSFTRIHWTIPKFGVKWKSSCCPLWFVLELYCNNKQQQPHFLLLLLWWHVFFSFFFQGNVYELFLFEAKEFVVS